VAAREVAKSIDSIVAHLHRIQDQLVRTAEVIRARPAPEGSAADRTAAGLAAWEARRRLAQQAEAEAEGARAARDILAADAEPEDLGIPLDPRD
jgi:hypothetical protein